MSTAPHSYKILGYAVCSQEKTFAVVNKVVLSWSAPVVRAVPELSTHTRSSADFITITCGFGFSVHRLAFEHETAKPARNRQHSDVMPKTVNAGGDVCRR
jgi:hypothetical protein